MSTSLEILIRSNLRSPALLGQTRISTDLSDSLQLKGDREAADSFFCCFVQNALRRMEVITQRDELTVDALFNLCNESGSGSISYQVCGNSQTNGGVTCFRLTGICEMDQSS